MEKRKYSNWWFLGVNGLVFALFGLLIVFLGEEDIRTLLRYIGVVMLVVGGVLLGWGINSVRKDKAAGMVLVEAIASLAIGIALLFFPQASVSLFLILTGIWAIIIGIIQLVIIINVGNTLRIKNLMMVNALLTIAMGVSLLFNPFQWAVIIVRMIGVLATLFGLLLVWFSFNLRSLKEEE